MRSLSVVVGVTVANIALSAMRRCSGDGKRCRILLSADLRPVRAHPKRAHQGWRYLAGADAPADLGGDEAEGMAALPSAMAAELSALALI